MNNETNNNYVYPVGDFLSGFSEDLNNPCDYELECQRMVIRGVEYFDKNPELHEWMSKNSCSVFDDKLKPLIDYMLINEKANEDEGFGQTGAMVSQAVTHSYHAKRLGWDEYIKQCVDALNERNQIDNN